MTRALLFYAFGCITMFLPDATMAIDKMEMDRVRDVVMSSRQFGAHGLGYGERSLNALSRQLTATDIPALIALLGGTNRSAVAGARFGLASQCGAAIDPVYAMATGPTESINLYTEAREVLAQVASYARCSAVERKRATEKSALLNRARLAFSSRRTQEIKRRRLEDARLQAEGLNMLDPSRRASTSREHCLAVVERSRVATGIKPGSRADSDLLLERARENCMKKNPRPQ